MITAPFQASSGQLLAVPHRNIVRAQLTHPSWGVVDLDLDADQGHRLAVTFDESSAPRARAELSCPLPTQPIDPRQGVRLGVSVGYQDGQAQLPEDVQELVDLVVRTASPSWSAAGAVLDVSASGDESLVIDASPAVSESTTGATHAAAIGALLNKSLSPAPELLATVTGASVTVDTIEDRWNALVDLADGIGAQLYDDGLRTWHLDPTPDTVSTRPHHELAVGVGGTVIEPSRTLTRDDWHNYVRIRYRWRNPAGADQQIIGTSYVTTGPYRITGPAGRRILTVDRDVTTTQTRANLAARSILTRTLSRGDVLELRAVAAYWLRPGMTVDVTLPTGQVLRHLVARVSFDVLAGTMTVATRLPLALPSDDAVTAPTSTSTPTTGATPDPAPVSKIRYTSEWPVSSVGCYRSTGTKRTDVPTLSLWQGTFSGSYNGNQRSVACFAGATSVPAAGKRGETGKTLAQALAGSDVERIELVATCEHTWSGSFTALVGYYAGTTVPATAPSMKAYASSKAWPEDSPRAVNVTSTAFVAALKAGTSNAVTLGPGAAGTTYYGRLGSLKLRAIYAR